MPTVDIIVNGRRHEMQCGEGEEARVKQLASYLDRRVTDLSRGQSQIGDSRLLLMAGLTVADELSDAFDEIKALKAALETRAGEVEERAADAVERVAQQLDAIAAELERA
jgi:cell division protein ZapA